MICDEQISSWMYNFKLQREKTLATDFRADPLISDSDCDKRHLGAGYLMFGLFGILSTDYFLCLFAIKLVLNSFLTKSSCFSWQEELKDPQTFVTSQKETLQRLSVFVGLWENVCLWNLCCRCCYWQLTFHSYKKKNTKKLGTKDVRQQRLCLHLFVTRKLVHQEKRRWEGTVCKCLFGGK